MRIGGNPSLRKTIRNANDALRLGSQWREQSEKECGGGKKKHVPRFARDDNSYGIRFGPGGCWSCDRSARTSALCFSAFTLRYVLRTTPEIGRASCRERVEITG